MLYVLKRSSYPGSYPLNNCRSTIFILWNVLLLVYFWQIKKDRESATLAKLDKWLLVQGYFDLPFSKHIIHIHIMYFLLNFQSDKYNFSILEHDKKGKCDLGWNDLCPKRISFHEIILVWIFEVTAIFIDINFYRYICFWLLIKRSIVSVLYIGYDIFCFKYDLSWMYYHLQKWFIVFERT